MSGYYWKDLIGYLIRNMQNDCEGTFEPDVVSSLGWLPVVSLIVYIIAFSIGRLRELSYENFRLGSSD